jgi:hypothetical protein
MFFSCIGFSYCMQYTINQTLTKQLWFINDHKQCLEISDLEFAHDLIFIEKRNKQKTSHTIKFQKRKVPLPRYLFQK